MVIILQYIQIIVKIFFNSEFLCCTPETSGFFFFFGTSVISQLYLNKQNKMEF